MPPVTYAAHRVSVIGHAFGQDIVNVYNVAGVSDATAAAQLVGEAFANAWKPNLPSAYSFGQADAIDMSSLTGDTASWPLSAFGTGAASGAAEVGTAAIVSWNDSLSGRGYRNGRSYIGPLPSSVVAAGGLTLVVGFEATFQSAATDFIADVNIGGTLVIAHGLGNPLTQQLAPVVSAAVRSNTAHLDSRRK